MVYQALQMMGEPNTYGIRLNDAKNCIIDGNKIQTCAPDGILITQDVDCGSVNNIVKHNQIQNLFGTATGQTGIFFGTWAIEDLTYTNSASGPLNTYYDNYAWDYPGGGPGMTNYNTGVREAGPNSPLYLWHWDIPGGAINPTGAFSKMSNVDITTAACVTDL